MLEPFVAVPSYAALVPAARHGLRNGLRDGLVTDATATDPCVAEPCVAEPCVAEPCVAEPCVAESRVADHSGLGPLAVYAASGHVTDIFVNGESGLWVDAGRGLVHEQSWQCDERSLRELAVRLIARGGRHIDEASPCVDVRLNDGIRVHAVLPPVSSTGTLLSIRLPHAERLSLAALASAGMCGVGEQASALVGRLRTAVRARENILITGAAGSGKTTLLAALLSEAPSQRESLRSKMSQNCASRIRTSWRSNHGRPTLRALDGSVWKAYCARHCGCVRIGSCSANAAGPKSANCWRR